MQEKRKFSRCRIKEKALIKKEDNREVEGFVLDVSMGGMRVLLDKPIKIGSKLSGQFKIVHYLGPFFVQGEVVWSKSTTDSKGNPCGYAIGAKFTKVSTIPFEK